MEKVYRFAKNKSFVCIVLLFFLHIFFMFYHLEKWTSLGWDQIDNAWAAVRILVAHKYPLVGMVAKGNSGMYIGPLYYYLVALFYYFTHLNPIASPILAGCTALMSFWIIYYVTSHLFTQKVAIASCFIYTFSSFIIRSERTQWPVNFIAPISLLIFYFLYKVVTGETKYVIHLAIATGLSFHVHFTSIFYPIIILISLPLVPLRKIKFTHILLALFLFILCITPQTIYYFQMKHTGLSAYSNYFQTYYHGLHLQRMLQLAHDAFIEFESILNTPYRILRNAVFFYLPLFFLVYYLSKPAKNWFKLFYLTTLWIAVPWLVFTTYSGEISDYYFLIQLYLAVTIFGYISMWLWDRKNIAIRACIVLFWLYYAVTNVQVYLNSEEGNFQNNMSVALEETRQGHIINFVEGNPQSYIGFYFRYIQHKPLPFGM